MNDQRTAQPSAIAAFHALHTNGCFVLPNPWDVGTTVYLQRLGFKALATTSAGFSFSRGTADGAVPRDEMLAHIREIAPPRRFRSMPISWAVSPRHPKALPPTRHSASPPASLAFRSRIPPETATLRSTKRRSRSSGSRPPAMPSTLQALPLS